MRIYRIYICWSEFFPSHSVQSKVRWTRYTRETALSHHIPFSLSVQIHVKLIGISYGNSIPTCSLFSAIPHSNRPPPRYRETGRKVPEAANSRYVCCERRGGRVRKYWISDQKEITLELKAPLCHSRLPRVFPPPKKRPTRGRETPRSPRERGQKHRET